MNKAGSKSNKVGKRGIWRSALGVQIVACVFFFMLFASRPIWVDSLDLELGSITSPAGSEGIGGDSHSSILTQSEGQQQVEDQVGRKVAKLQIPFILNQGQKDKRVKFYAPTFGGTVFVTNEGEIVYSLPKTEGETIEAQDLASPEPPRSEARSLKLTRGVVFKEELIGGKVSVEKAGREAITKVSYFRGNDPTEWRGNIPTYEIVSLGEVYEGVEVKLKAYGKSMEKLFFVKPEGDAESIRMKVASLGTSHASPLEKSLNINDDGELEVETELGNVKFTKPVAYQERKGKREFVEVAYVTKGDEYGFKVGEYDRTNVLVIDPILASTFLGGGGLDVANAIALDGSGNVYVAGRTVSANFPGVVAGASADSTFAGSDEAFVAKLDSGLSSILAATFLGGGGFDEVNAITVSSGDVYVAGETSSADFPGVATGASADGTFVGSGEAFVAKLDSGLGSILAATFLGGGGFDEVKAITVSSGNVYVAGQTSSADLPGVVAGVSADSSLAGNSEAFIAGLDPGLSSILASTFLGGSGSDVANAIDLDGGNIYVAGDTASADFPGVVAGISADSTLAGTSEAFIAGLDPGLSSILASTFLGGSGFDETAAIAFDGAGNVYVAGQTGSRAFPGIVAGVSADSAFVGTNEAYVTKLDPGLSLILASTFLGGRKWDDVNAMVLASSGNVYVTGETGSKPFPRVVAGVSADSTFAGPFEAFVSKLNPGLSSVLASTYLGGGATDAVNAIALDSAGNLYVVGKTGSAAFPGVVAGVSADSTLVGSEAHVTKLDPAL